MRVKWLPLMANSFGVSGIVIAELGVRATTRSAAYMGSSSIGSYGVYGLGEGWEGLEYHKGEGLCAFNSFDFEEKYDAQGLGMSSSKPARNYEALHLKQLPSLVPEEARLVEWMDKCNECIASRRISLTGFRSCTSRSRYQSVSKQTTRISIVIVNTKEYHSDVLARSQR
ncbi:hypothetical protein Tco_0321359 [Tanacetum coccineum]